MMKPAIRRGGALERMFRSGSAMTAAKRPIEALIAGYRPTCPQGIPGTRVIADLPFAANIQSVYISGQHASQIDGPA